jgi:hypothetical protein
MRDIEVGLWSSFLWVLKKKKRGTVGVDGWGSCALMMGLPLFVQREEKRLECGGGSEGEKEVRFSWGLRFLFVCVERTEGYDWLWINGRKRPLFVFLYMGGFQHLLVFFNFNFNFLRGRC